MILNKNVNFILTLIYYLFINIKPINVFAYNYFKCITNQKSIVCSECGEDYTKYGDLPNRIYYICENDGRILDGPCYDSDFNEQLINILFDIEGHENVEKCSGSNGKIDENATNNLIEKVMNNDEFKKRYPRTIFLGYQKDLERLCLYCLDKIDFHEQHYTCVNGHWLHKGCRYNSKMKCPACKEQLILRDYSKLNGEEKKVKENLRYAIDIYLYP